MEKRKGSRYTDLTGTTFGKLVVVGFHEKGKHGHYKWLCKCECGNESVSFASNLLRGIATSCGCYGRNIIGGNTRTHGMSKTRMFKIWVGIRKRCTNPNMTSYKDYGGRGIKVCERWDEYINFYNDMKDGYSDSLTLERDNPNGDYEKSNCRWATSKEQGRNKRNTRSIDLEGRSLTAAAWAEISGTESSTIIWRIKKGWDVRRAIYGDPVTDLSEISKYLVF